MRPPCCNVMGRHLQIAAGSAATSSAADRPLLYDPVFDEYRLVSADLLADHSVLTWCPWCGARLPPSQRERWYAEVARLGLSPDDVLPDHLRTDAWWMRQA